MGQCFEISNSHTEAGYIEQFCFSGFCFHDYQVYSIDSFGYVITDPENAAIVSLYNSVSGNENHWGNSLPIGSDDVFDRLMFYGYYSVENWEEE